MRLVSLLSAALLACGGGSASEDGGVHDAALDAGSVVAAPEVPWLEEGAPPVMPPLLTPCPTGWRVVPESGGGATCDPYPKGGAAVCAGGEAHFPGAPGCAPVGDACPTGDYASTLPSGTPIVYVNAAALAAGDGTLAAPFASLGEVTWSALAAGATVALARGTYDGVVPVRAGVRVVGACARETVLTGVTFPAQGVITAASAGAEPAVVENVTIRDAPQPGAYVSSGRALALRGVVVERATGVGVLASGSRTSLTARDVVVRGTVGEAGRFGRGVSVELGALASLERAIIEDNTEAGVFAASAEVMLSDTVIRETRERSADGEWGRGLHAQGGARVEATRVLIERNRDTGALAANLGTTISLTDAVVRDTSPRRSGVWGMGLVATDFGHIAASRTVVANNHAFGVAAGDPSEVVLTDVVVRDTLAGTSGFGARGGYAVGVSAELGAQLTATRAHISNAIGRGVGVLGDGTRAVLTDVTVSDTANDGLEGHGVTVADNARLEAERVIVERTTNLGVTVWGASASLTDVLVDVSGNAGVQVANGGELDASRVLVASTREFGVMVDGAAAVVRASDFVIRGVTGRMGDLAFGDGLQLQGGARLTGDRIAIDDVHEVGLVSVRGSTADVRDLSIRTVHASECACERNFAHGVAAISSTVTLTRFRIEDAEVCGLLVASEDPSGSDPALDVADGIVQRTAIGACVQVDAYDVARLSEGVVYRDNGVNLDSTSLPVPPVGGASVPSGL